MWVPPMRDAPRSDERTVLRDPRAIFDAIPVAGWLARSDGGLVSFNREFLAYTGAAAETLEGARWVSVLDPEAAPSVLAQWNEAVQRGEPFTTELRLRRHDGVLRWFALRASKV